MTVVNGNDAVIYLINIHYTWKGLSILIRRLLLKTARDAVFLQPNQSQYFFQRRRCNANVKDDMIYDNITYLP